MTNSTTNDIVGGVIRSVGRIFDRVNGEMRAVKKAETAVYADISAKQVYVRRMIQKIIATDKLLVRALNDLQQAETDEEKIRAYRNGIHACVELCIYENTLAGTDMSVFEEHQSDLAGSSGRAFHVAYNFYMLFQSLLSQSRLCFRVIGNEIETKSYDLDIMLAMFIDVVEAYNEFLSELERL